MHDTEPDEVDADLLAEVLPDVMDRLIVVPSTPSRPVLIEHLSCIELHLTVCLVWTLYAQASS